MRLGLAFALAPLFLGACRRETARAEPLESPAPSAPPPPSSAIAARPYAVHEPPRHEPRAPLLVLLHGLGGDHAEVARRFGIEALADEHGFFVALPDGTTDTAGRRFWNASEACCNFDDLPVDDVAYLDELLRDALARYPIDPSRVYLAGYSNGGFMAHRYACDRAERIAAVVSLAGDPWKDAALCKPRVPVSVLQVHGEADNVVLYGGGPATPATRGSLPLGALPSAKDAVAMWSRLDGCTGRTTTDSAREELARYGPCAGGTAVQLWTLHGTGHVLDRTNVDMERLWSFLAAHERK